MPLQPTYVLDDDGMNPNYVKYEPGTLEYHQLLANNSGGVFVSPDDSITTGDSSSPNTFPSCDVPDSVKDEWNAAMKMPVDLIQLENLGGVLAAYDGLDPIETAHGFTDNPTLDFSLYDSLNFSIPPEDGVNLVDQHYVGSI